MEKLADLIEKIIDKLLKPKPTIKYLSGKGKPKND
jgi:hypothetical protein